MEILKGQDGTYSSKRTLGIVYMLTGLGMAVVDQFTDFNVTYEVWLTIVLTGASLLGLGLFEYFGKGKTIEPPEKP